MIRDVIRAAKEFSGDIAIDGCADLVAFERQLSPENNDLLRDFARLLIDRQTR